MATDPRYMSFDHQYVETVSTSATIAAHRFVTRGGAYPANDGDFAAGVSVYDAPGAGQLTAKGYQVDNGSVAVYEGQLNPSTTPAKPGVFPYQGLLSIVTEGIAIVKVDSDSNAIALDGPVYSSDSGEAIDSGGTGNNYVLGRALDAATGTGTEYIRVKLGSEGAS